jgi:hypothetical protein
MSYLALTIGQEIELLEDMHGCVSEGKRVITKGTKMRYYFSQLTWDYFKDSAGNTLIIMGGPGSLDWERVKAN